MGVGLLTIAVCIVASVGLHLVALRRLWRYAPAAATPASGFRIALLVIGCIVVHIVEIGVFAVGMAVVGLDDGDSRLVLGAFQDRNLDLWFYSASFYTSLGADRPPTAGLRLFAGCEALVGLILITWTASFLFLLMQEAWVSKDRHAAP